MLIETYQTTAILIDDNRLINGEEGCLCNFDLEKIENGHKDGTINIKELSNNDIQERYKQNILNMFKSSISQKALINEFSSRLGILLHAGIYKIKSTAWKGVSKSALAQHRKSMKLISKEMTKSGLGLGLQWLNSSLQNSDQE